MINYGIKQVNQGLVALLNIRSNINSIQYAN